MHTLGTRVLYMPNEHGTARQRGPRLALTQLLEAGLIEDLLIFSFQLRLAHSTKAATFEELRKSVRQFGPTLVLVQHPAGTGLNRHDWRTLRDSGDFRLIYHEGDAYDRLRKRVPKEFRDLGSAADVSFTAGASTQLELLRSAGSRDARWTPSVFNPHDFGSRPMPRDREYDVVMVANESSSRAPLMSIPGSRDRVRLARALEKRFGRKFAVYGRGWKGPCAKGPLTYLDQESAVQSAWVSTNWDHYPREAKSFSDRLPIALASGTVHVTTKHPGYGSLFPADLGFLHHEISVETIVQRIERVLGSTDTTSLTDLMRAGRRFAHDHFRQDDNLVELLNAGGACIDSEAASKSWTLQLAASEQI